MSGNEKRGKMKEKETDYTRTFTRKVCKQSRVTFVFGERGAHIVFTKGMVNQVRQFLLL